MTTEIHHYNIINIKLQSIKIAMKYKVLANIRRAHIISHAKP